MSNEETLTESQWLDRLMEELQETGIDTSEWEYKYGDGSYTAGEFLARAFKELYSNPETP